MKIIYLAAVGGLLALAYVLGKEMERQHYKAVNDYWDRRVGVKDYHKGCNK